MLSTCDQASTNIKAINQLIDHTKKRSTTATGCLLTYTIGNQNIIHCWDPPHLIKGVRNNLMTKKLVHHLTKRWNVDQTVSTERRLASWKHIRESYRRISKSSIRTVKITPEHLDPVKSKMRVGLAAQIFSEKFGNTIHQLCGNRSLPQRFTDTAEVLLFFNDIFDSVNGAHTSGKNELRSSVKKDSVHFEFWRYALRMLSKMNFLDPKTGKPTKKTYVIQHFQSTIRGYMEMCKKCFELNVPEIALRYVYSQLCASTYSTI